MQSTFKRIDSWHKALRGRVTFGVLELALAYITASRAIDTGSLLQYGVTAFLVIGAVVNFVEAAKTSRKPHARQTVKRR